MHRSNIKRYEDGDTDPSLEAVEKMADALDCTPALLLTPPAEESPLC